MVNLGVTDVQILLPAPPLDLLGRLLIKPHFPHRVHATGDNVISAVRMDRFPLPPLSQ